MKAPYLATLWDSYRDVVGWIIAVLVWMSAVGWGVQTLRPEQEQEHQYAPQEPALAGDHAQPF